MIRRFLRWLLRRQPVKMDGFCVPCPCGSRIEVFPVPKPKTAFVVRCRQCGRTNEVIRFL